MKRRDAQSGQALTEFAIVVPVIVCLVLFSIYFYELLSVKLKAQEAARYAAWEATSYQLSDYAAKNPRSKNRQLFETARSAIESETWARYEDLDSSSVARIKGVPGKVINKVRGRNYFLATEWEVERVRLRNDEPPEINGNFLFELGFDIGLQVAGWVESLLRDFDNPYTAAAMASFLRHQYSPGGYGFNEDGYVEADVRISVTNRLLPRHYMDQGGDAWFSNRFLRRTSVDFNEHVELLADPWKLVEGNDVRHGQTSGGFFQQVDRFFLAGSEGRAAAQPVAQLARLAVMLGMGGGELPDPLEPVVVSVNYGPGERAIGTVNLGVDEGRGRHDSSPYSVIHAYEDTFGFSSDDADGRPGRGNYYMGCAEPMQLGCTDSLSRDNPFGEGILPPGPDQGGGRGGGGRGGGGGGGGGRR